MSTLIPLIADYTLFVIAAGAGVAWLLAPREERIPFALDGVAAAAFVGLLVKVAGALWSDPRPFVVDHVTPLISHAVDNGFPSDHTALAAAVAVVVWQRQRLIGGLLLALTVLLGWSRVDVLVHHWPDIIAGMSLGAAAGFGATALVRWAWLRHTDRRDGLTQIGVPY